MMRGVLVKAQPNVMPQGVFHLRGPCPRGFLALHLVEKVDIGDGHRSNAGIDPLGGDVLVDQPFHASVHALQVELIVTVEVCRHLGDKAKNLGIADKRHGLGPGHNDRQTGKKHPNPFEKFSPNLFILKQVHTRIDWHQFRNAMGAEKLQRPEMPVLQPGDLFAHPIDSCRGAGTTLATFLRFSQSAP